jgi:SAM-dependent methyltransferase
MDLVEQNYWNESYKDFNFYIPSDAVTKFLDKYSPTDRSSVFEIGCFPGRYLAHLGKNNWVVNGMDLAPGTETVLVAWMKSQQIKTDFVKNGNVLNYLETTNHTYPFVCSFGFIEHFENFEEIIKLHARIVKPNGTLLITTPNFRGRMQFMLHKYLDRENFNRHYIPSMQPDIWKDALEKNGFRVEFSGFFGNFDFWVDRQKRNFLQKGFAEFFQRIAVPMFSWLPNSPTYSPYCGIVAKRIK